MNKAGKFITFEGPDGAGKTTQIRLLQEKLAAKGFPCIVTREPGGTDISNRIRSILLDPACVEMSPFTEVLLYAASRAQHVHEKIRPALSEGNLVLCDRYIDASIAYQSAGLGISSDLVRKWSEVATGGLWPDRTYLIDVPVETGLARIESRSPAGLDRIELRGYEYHQRVREQFLAIARAEPHRICLVDGTQPIEKIAADIWEDWLTFSNE